MSDINAVVLMGNLVRDPEMRYTAGGTAVCRLSIANNQQWKDKKKTNFIECSAFGKTAENIAKFFKKGMRIMVQGSMSQETWDDKQTGAKRSMVKLMVSQFFFIDRKEGGASRADTAAAAQRASEQDVPAGNSAVMTGGEDDMDLKEDDIPF